jgi:hypothetical protein
MTTESRVFSKTTLPTTFEKETFDRRDSSQGRTTSPSRTGNRLIAMYATAVMTQRRPSGT